MSGPRRARIVSSGGQTASIPVTVTESSLPFTQQATSATSLMLIVVAILAIAVSVVTFNRARAARRELDEGRKGGGPSPPP